MNLGCVDLGGLGSVNLCSSHDVTEVWALNVKHTCFTLCTSSSCAKPTNAAPKPLSSDLTLKGPAPHLGSYNSLTLACLTLPWSLGQMPALWQ